MQRYFAQKLLAAEGAVAATPPAAAAASTPAPAAAAPAPLAGGDNPFAEIDAAFDKEGIPPAKSAEPPPKKPAEAAPDPKKPALAAPSKPIPTATDKAPGVPKELRAELDRVKGELKTKNESHAALEAKIADYEKRGLDTTKLAERLTTMEKDMESLRAENRALKRETSPEFKAKYEAPFTELVADAQSTIPQIEITDVDTGAVTKATWSDFQKLYGYNKFLANKEAKKLFGEDGASIAMDYYNRLHALDATKNKALDEEKANWKKNQEAEEAHSIQTREATAQTWTQLNKELSEKVEDYHDNPEDKELADARTKALSVMDHDPKTPGERLLLQAHIRQRAAAFVPMKLILGRKDKEITALKSELDGLKTKVPSGGKRPGGGETAHAEDDWETGFRKDVGA